MYRNLNFTNGVFTSVWVEDSDGKKIASFPCNLKDLEKAKNFAKILTDTLNIVTANNTLIIDEIKDKHPYAKWDNGAPIYTCPNCKETEIGYADNNCSNCGQKLEWNYH